MYQYSFLIRASTHIVKKLKQTNNLQNCLTCNTQFPEVYPTQKTPPKNTHTHTTHPVLSSSSDLKVNLGLHQPAIG